MEPLLFTESLIIILLLVASLVAIAVRRLHVPYTVALVVVGLLVTTQQTIAVSVTPELILAFFVPPLVFEAAFHLTAAELRRSLSGILMLAVPGVVATTLIVGAWLAQTTALGPSGALVFGALIAATDPVAVVALFRALGVPKRLSALVEGESLLNDGTAIVVFNIVVAMALTGRFDPLQGVADFVRVSAGGTIVGLALGWAVARLISRVDDYLIETTLTTVLAYGAYLAAEWLHFSGVLAVVSAGLICGNLGPKGMSPTTRIVLFNFWEYVAFLANSLLFLLIGLQVNIGALLANWEPVAWAIAIVLFARALVVYALGWIINRFFEEPVPNVWQHILVWGGLRGAISFALVLSLPDAMGDQRDLIRLMTFGVVLFTLLIQSTTMGKLLHRLRILVRNEAQDEYAARHGRLVAMRAADEHLDSLYRDGLLSPHVWETLKRATRERIGALSDAVREATLADPSLAVEELETGRRELLRAQKGALLNLRRERVISEDAYEKLSAEVDAELMDGASLDPAGEIAQDPKAKGRRA
ncbi:MAG: Na+/H+ antiporter [Chloroflexi bacterium]|nr:Na+/H+ antiporter [Chloroflexota bacterium]